MRQLFFYSLTVTTLLSYSQKDTLKLKSGEKFAVDLIEVSNDQVSYKRFDYQNSPMFKTDLNSISKIKYRNGVEDDVSEISTTNRKINDKRNYIGFDVAGLPFKSINVEYEHTFRNRKMSLRVPLSVSFANRTAYVYNQADILTFYDGKILSTGLHLSFLPFGTRQHTFFWGPALSYGAFRYRDYFYYGYYDQSGTYYVPSIGGFKLGHQIAATMNVGMRHYITERFNFRWNLGCGLKTDLTQGTRITTQPKGNASIAIGYSF